MPIPFDENRSKVLKKGNHLPERDVALCRSILYEALALGFRPPTPETRHRLIDAGSNGALAAAAQVAARKRTGLETRVRRLATWKGTLAGMRKDYQRLFGHSVRGPVPLYETEYGRGTVFQQPHELADLSGFLCAFGLVQHPESRDRVDHLSCECEFLLFLARKEAFAYETGEGDLLRATVAAERLFLKDHLGQFGPAFCRILQRQDPEGFYGRLAGILQEFLQSECARFGVKTGSEALPLRPDHEDAAPMACGAAPDLIQIGHRPGQGRGS